MLFGNKESVDAETFWRKRQEETGSPILAKTLGRIVSGERKPPVWGLLYTTEHSVYFQTFKTNNWVSMLLGGNSSNGTEDKIVEISKEEIKTFCVRNIKGGMFGLFKQPPQVELRWISNETGNEEVLFFETDRNPQKLVDSFNGNTTSRETDLKTD